jgi:hypothetical protein
MPQLRLRQCGSPSPRVRRIADPGDRRLRDGPAAQLATAIETALKCADPVAAILQHHQIVAIRIAAVGNQQQLQHANE